MVSTAVKVARRRDEGRGRRAAAALLAAAGASAVLSLLATVDYQQPSPMPPRRQLRAACVSETRNGTNSMPWRVYDGFASRHDGCSTATFVAQYEGGCDDMVSVLEKTARRAGFANASAWLGGAAAGPDECAVCVLGEWEKENFKLFEDERKRTVLESGGPTESITCVFEDGTRVQARVDPGFHRHRSTLVWECDVPLRLRNSACQDKLWVGFETGPRSHPFVRLCTFAPPNVELAACTWTSARPYVDRDGKSKSATTPAALEEWFAAHLAFGVEFFVVFDDDARWDLPTQSALWPAIEPLVRRGKASLLPWPHRACGARGDGPWVRVDGGQRSALSMQSFWGRPVQYAAQNACHRRLQRTAKWVAHLDVDEFAVPASDSGLLPMLREYGDNVASLALPHVFYAACPDDAPNGTLLFAGRRFCAGKAQPSRTKQLTRAKAVHYIQDHYIRIADQGAKVIDLNALTHARLAHARQEYAFSGPATARFASTHKERDVPSNQRTVFDERILPRLRNLDCQAAPTDNICPRGFKLKARDPPDASANSGDPFCWCRDSALRTTWFPRVQDALRRLHTAPRARRRR